MKIEIREISPSNKEAKEVFSLLDQHNLSHCPPDVCHLTQPDELERIDSVLLGVFCDDTLCGMGGLKFYTAYAEVTRMYLRESARGNGLAERLLKQLENQALSRNLNILKLETSDKFVMAVKLYKKYGFKICPPFGEYISKPYNLYMELSIGQ